MRDSGEVAPIIEKAVVVVLFATLVFGVLMILKPFAVAILFGVILAISSWPLREALIRAGARPALAASLMLAAALVLLIGPVLAVAPTLTGDVKALFGEVMHALERGLPRPPWLQSLPLAGPWLDQNWDRLFGSTQGITSAIAPYSEWLRATVTSLAGSLADSLLQLVLALAVAAMLWASGRDLAVGLDGILERLGGKRFLDLSTIARNAVCGSVYGIAGTAVAQAALMYVGLVVAGIPAAMPLAFVTLILAASQIGTILIHLVWIGAAWWLHENVGDGFRFWFIIVWGIVVTHIDGVLKPLLIGKRISMPMALVMLGVFGGFVSFGFLGLFIGPAILAVAWALLSEWRAPSRIDAMLHAEGKPDPLIAP
jgi:predicted PurR-regulated permease PerM